MFNLYALLAGLIVGGLIAWRRKGNTLDILQYAVVYGVIFSLIALFYTIFANRAG